VLELLLCATISCTQYFKSVISGANRPKTQLLLKWHDLPFQKINECWIKNEKGSKGNYFGDTEIDQAGNGDHAV
jgi:hypothetical protein